MYDVLLFDENNLYKINDIIIENECEFVRINNYHNSFYYFYIDIDKKYLITKQFLTGHPNYLWEYFYSEKELRKLKLNEIKNRDKINM